MWDRRQRSSNRIQSDDSRLLYVPPFVLRRTTEGFQQFEAYKTEQLPIIKKDQPGMRLVQYENQLVRTLPTPSLAPD